MANKPKHTSREDWLNAATVELRAHIKATTGVRIPAVRVSVGFPYRSRGAAIGQCWAGVTVKDGKPAIFISPVLTDRARVLDVLAHELIHAAFPTAGHTGDFSKTAKAIGLVAPWTATTASPEFKREVLRPLAKSLGTYPHSRIGSNPERKTRKGEPPKGEPPKGDPRVVGKQGTRMLKVECPEDGYTVRTTRKWLEVGNPSCPAGHEMAEV